MVLRIHQLLLLQLSTLVDAAVDAALRIWATACVYQFHLHLLLVPLSLSICPLFITVESRDQNR